MNERIKDKVLAFDTLFTTNRICKLKVMISYLDRSAQQHLAVYIKYLELQYTMSFFRSHPACQLSEEASFDFSGLCSELLPYCTSAERTRMESMQNMFRTVENMKEMMEMAEMMKDLFPEGASPQDGTNPLSSIADFLGGMEPGADASQNIFQPAQLFQMLNFMKGDDKDNGHTE